MKVIMINTGKTEEYNESFAARLVEQGKAVLVTKAEKPVKKEAEKKADKEPEKAKGAKKE